MKNILQHNNLTIAKADKSKAIVTIDKTTLVIKNRYIYTGKQNNEDKQGSNGYLSKANTTNHDKM
jgi:hypothetical protein